MDQGLDQDLDQDLDQELDQDLYQDLDQNLDQNQILCRNQKQDKPKNNLNWAKHSRRTSLSVLKL